MGDDQSERYREARHRLFVAGMEGEGRRQYMVDGLNGKKAAIIVADEFEDLELFHPMYRLQEEGVKTVVIGLSRMPVKGKKGYTIEPALSIDE